CLKHLRTAEFKPYVVFVKPPSIERLRETRKSTKTVSEKGDKDVSKALTDEDFEEMISAARLMESQYSHLFDLVLVNDDLASVFGELKRALRKVEMETHWVPISWTHS
ncbi:MAGUK p55 subfamily member 7, partial [Tachysurus ichikawai]